MGKNQVCFSIRIPSSEMNESNVLSWIEELLFFEPSEMYGSLITSRKYIPFNKRFLIENLGKELRREQFKFSLSTKDLDHTLVFKKGIFASSISGHLSSKIFEDVQEEFTRKISSLFENGIGVVASIYAQEDYFWQNNIDPMIYKRRNRSLENIRVIPSPNIKNELIIDSECLPGHAHYYEDIWFGSHWMMWFGKKYYQYIPREALLRFKDGWKTEELSNEALFIQLYPNIWDYDLPNNRELQWLFRQQAGVDEVAHFLENEGKYIAEAEVDPAIEIFTEKNCMHGGVRMVRYHYNDQKQVVPRSQATVVFSYEVDEQGYVVWECFEPVIR
ncbi:hypothetical protein D3P08_23205 [Paenibacillus nanensis]|uniref:Uncharacterized protein n=1 Tax=Paenibacillus nanensis TaxID=393251 RepID=A0A3A1UMA1_9BACL|nr:hypothetical protein [Paenibacillus nanensis]RIX49248.1 hypothetical protein D3P08_23205 [Paenibacillus nanensis]